MYRKFCTLFLGLTLFSPFLETYGRAIQSQGALSRSGFPPLVCKTQKQQKLTFTKTETKNISLNSGLDPRSICTFTLLASNVYPKNTLKSFLEKDHSQLKIFFNSHILFKPDPRFFGDLSAFLFSPKYKDTDQIIYSLVLIDLLYGFNIGETLPIYMKIFLYYSSENKNNPQEVSASKKIIQYIVSIKQTLLKQDGFTPEAMNNYLKKVKNEFKAHKK